MRRTAFLGAVLLAWSLTSGTWAAETSLPGPMAADGEPGLAETIAGLRAARGDQAGIAVEGDREIVVAIGHAPWNAEMSPRERLQATLAAAIRARKAAAAYLFGEGSASSTRIASRVETTITESGTTSISTKERAQFVQRTIAGVLRSMRVRELIEDPERRRLIAVLTSESLGAASFREGMPLHASPESAAAAVLEGMADGSIVPCGGMLVWLGEARRPAVVGLGAVPLKGEHASRGEQLVAGRKAAAGLVAFLRGEEISGTDEFTEVLRTVVRDDDRAAPGDAGSTYARSMTRLASSMSKGTVPGGNTPAERVATLADGRYLFSVIVVPIERE